ncbi:MAG: aminotransferase class V-fold PLP-dependent enzyme, partial [Bacteroidetes bacterium]|nr:aminotransferase class V-fold PLP-dependent enzyme [Bacteroidota bacterium]
LAIELKDQMTVQRMHERENFLVELAFKKLRNIPKIHILADLITNRLGIISFYTESIHYNLIVRILSDRFGVQVRGGCACAGTYGHYLLNVSHDKSKKITDKINTGDLSEKPGWVRISLHPTMKDEELNFILDAIEKIVENHQEWGSDYTYDKHTNEFRHKKALPLKTRIDSWYNLTITEK